MLYFVDDSLVLPSHLDRVRSIDRDLVISGIAAGQAEVEVFDLQVEVRQDQLRLDVVPVKRE